MPKRNEKSALLVTEAPAAEDVNELEAASLENQEVTVEVLINAHSL